MKRYVAAESIIDALETVACVCRVSRNDKNPVGKGCLSARIVFGYCRRKSVNPGSPGKKTTHYHRASWQGGFFAQYPFLAGPSDVADRSGTLRPRRGEELDLAMEPRVLFGPQRPCRGLQRKGTERSVRSFGPWSCKKSGKSSPGPARTPQHTQQAVNDRVGLRVRRSRRVCHKSRYYARLCSIMQEANTVWYSDRTRCCCHVRTDGYKQVVVVG